MYWKLPWCRYSTRPSIIIIRFAIWPDFIRIQSLNSLWRSRFHFKSLFSATIIWGQLDINKYMALTISTAPHLYTWILLVYEAVDPLPCGRILWDIGMWDFKEMRHTIIHPLYTTTTCTFIAAAKKQVMSGHASWKSGSSSKQYSVDT